jgi:hypothetical protein
MSDEPSCGESMVVPSDLARRTEPCPSGLHPSALLESIVSRLIQATASVAARPPAWQVDDRKPRRARWPSSFTAAGSSGLARRWFGGRAKRLLYKA